VAVKKVHGLCKRQIIVMGDDALVTEDKRHPYNMDHPPNPSNTVRDEGYVRR
jgi:hypothetical protein